MKFDILSLRRTDSVKILYTQRPAHRAGVLRFDPGAAGAGLDDLALEGQGCDAHLDERAFFGKEKKHDPKSRPPSPIVSFQVWQKLKFLNMSFWNFWKTHRPPAII